MAPFLISIEGNIGSGKSTLLAHLKEHLKIGGSRRIVYVDEPVGEWSTITDANGRGMLELFYENPAKYAFSFQMMAYISRLANLQLAIKTYPNHVIIMERSLLTDYHVFAKMLNEKGNLLPEEFSIYKKWFYHFNTHQMDGLIYLECSPEVALERCTKRNRPGETISLEYLEELHERHETWIHQIETRPFLHIQNDTTDIDDSLFAIEDFLNDIVIPEDEGYFMTHAYASYIYTKCILGWLLYTILVMLKKA